MRLTHATAKVLAALLAEPAGHHYGYDLMRETGLKSGVLYPILALLHGWEWVERHWEHLDEDAGRPPRRYYRLTGAGAREARQWIDAAASERGTLAVRPL